jgi:hypothetical protein
MCQTRDILAKDGTMVNIINNNDAGAKWVIKNVMACRLN